MKCRSIKDFENLPSVLDVEEVSLLLVELVVALRRENVAPLDGAELIGNLIFDTGYSKKSYSREASDAVIAWTNEHYNPSDIALTEAHFGNVVNMRREQAIKYLESCLNKACTSSEISEITQALQSIGVKT